MVGEKRYEKRHLIHGYNGIPKIYKWLEKELKKLK